MQIVVRGSEGTHEHSAAIELRALFERELRDDTPGTICIRSNVIGFGQRRRELDLLVLMHFPSGIRRKLTVSEGAERRDCEVHIHSAVLCIEVKDHGADQVRADRIGTVEVQYKDRWVSATQQSSEQLHLAKDILSERLSKPPTRICHAIWFRNLSKRTLRDHEFPENCLPKSEDMTLRMIFGVVALQSRPIQVGDRRIISAWGDDRDDKHPRELTDLLHQLPKPVGDTTNRRVSRIREPLLKSQKYAEAIGERLVIFRGRAGTGKTATLLRIGYELCTSRNKRCLFLTYNNALVSDVRRTICLLGVNTVDEPRRFEAMTLHTMVEAIGRGLGASVVRGPGEEYKRWFSRLKAEILRTLGEDDYAGLLRSEYPGDFGWDFVLVDEGQDCPEDERNIMLRMFGSERLLVADGIDQLVRGGRIDWERGVHPEPHICYVRRNIRQKPNLCRLVQAFADHSKIDWDLEPQPDATGGRVVIVDGEYTRALHDELWAACRTAKNDAYEILFITPPRLVRKMEDGKRRFSLAETWAEWGVRLWDGTDTEIRKTQPEPDEHRVVQYESCRGLEAFCVVCLELDQFLDLKARNFEWPESDPRLIEPSPEERVTFATRWAMVPLTRATDILVITLRDRTSYYARKLQEIAKRDCCFVEWRDC